MIRLKDYDNSKHIIENRINPYISIYLLTIWFIILLFAFVMFTYKYHNYLNYYGSVVLEDNSYYISIYVKQTDIPLLNKYLIIENKKYEYKIKNISNELYINNSLTYKVDISIDLANEYLIHNNIIDLNFEIEEKTLYQSIKEKIKKGMRQ